MTNGAPEPSPAPKDDEEIRATNGPQIQEGADTNPSQTKETR